MKLLGFGTSGQLALELARRVPAGTTLTQAGRDIADFTDPDACLHLVQTTDADAIINAVAYTAVDQAEDNEALAVQINGTTPGLLANAAATRGLPFVHVSTDYVFDGCGTEPFAPDHPTAPLGVYGRSKLDGENRIRQAGGPHAILRTSWVVSAHGRNFVKSMLHLGRTRDHLTIVADQVGGPTPASCLADACLRAADTLITDPTGATGTYHFSGSPDASWADFAREIFDQAGISCTVQDIPSSEYPTPAERPKNSRMDCTTLTQTFGLTRPDWRVELKTLLQELDEAAP